MTPVEQITSLYIGYFGRAPDPEGLNYWVGRFADGFSLAEIAESFSVQQESTTKYPYLANPNIASPDAFIMQVYMNLFNRAPDAEGLAYWRGELLSGADVGQFILNVISGAVTAPDSTIVDNKIAVGVDFAMTAANQADFEYNDAAADAAVEVINGVDETQASVDEAFTETDEFFEQNVGQTFTLTEGSDTILGAPGNLVGSTGTVNTDGDDTIIAGVSTSGGPAANNLGSGDVIDGGLGFDTLRIIDDVGAALTPNVTGVERIDVQNLSGGLTINLINTTEVEEIWNVNSTGDVNVTEINDDVILGFENTDTNLVAQFDEDAIADGAIDVAVIGSGEEPSTAGFTILNPEGAVALNVDTTNNDVDTLNVSATGAASRLVIDNVTSDDDITTLTLSGEAELYLNAGDISGDLETVTSTSTGNVTLVIGGNGEDLSVSLGSGDDRLVLSAGTFDEDDTIALGAGEDALELHFDGGDIDLDEVDPDVDPNDTINAINASIGVETLIVDVWQSGSEVVDLDASDFTSVEDFVFDDTDDGISTNVQEDLDGDITVTGVADSNTFTFATNVFATADFTAAAGADVLELAVEGDIDRLVTTDFTTVNLELTNDENFFLSTFDGSEDTAFALTGVAEGLDILLGDEDGQTLDASGVETEGETDVDYSGPTTVLDVTDANFLIGGGGDDTIIGTAQDDVIRGDTLVAGVEQETEVQISAFVDAGDSYTITINGVDITYTAVAGDDADSVETALANLVNVSFDPAVDPISASTASGNLVLTGDADGTPFTVATSSENAEATAQTTTLSMDPSNTNLQFNDGDEIQVNVAGQLITSNALAADLSPTQAAQVLAAAIASNLVLQGLGITAVAGGETVTIIGNPDGTPFAVALAGDGVPVEGLATSDIEFSEFNVTFAGDVVTANVNGESIQFVSDGNEATDAVTLQNLINGNAALASQGVTAAIDGVDLEQVNITDADGNDIANSLTITGGGGATGSIQTGDTVNANSLGAPVTSAGFVAGANGNGPGDFTVTDQADGAAAIGPNADTLTGGAGEDLFIVQNVFNETVALEDLGDVITDFTDGEDLISFEFFGFGSAGTAANYSEGPVNGSGNFTGALALANNDFIDGAGNILYSAQQVGADVYVFADTDGGFDADQVVILTGTTLADLSNDGSFIV